MADFSLPLRMAGRAGFVLLIALLVGGIFAVDLALPLGIAGGVPYVIPVLMTLWVPDRRLVLPLAAVCSVLTLADVALSPPGEPMWVVIPNRTLALVAIWSVALLASSRRRAEEALARSEARTRAVLATTADALLTLDRDGRITSANPAAERVFGLDTDALAARTLGDLLSGTERAQFVRDPRMYLEGLSPETAYEAEAERPGGAVFPLELVVVAHPLGETVQYTATVRYISDRRLIEQHLLRAGEAERQAIGQELHEELGQVLTGLNLISRHLARHLEAQHAGEAEEAAGLAATLHEADALALRLFRALVPVDATEGLPEALNRLADGASCPDGLRCTVALGGALPPMEPLQAAQLYRIVEDVVAWARQSGCIREIEVGNGEDGADGVLTVRLTGTSASDLPEWAGLVRRLDYRARLVGKRVQARAAGDDGLLVSCAW